MPQPPAALATALADRYRLERELGEGGMATVYLADDLKHHRKVALKVLRPELAAILGAERFLHEIRTTANLQHPHILPLHDSGQVEQTVFYVMPYVEGESLRDRLNREKQLPVDEAVKLAGQVASALDYAHRHGVIHRDIKPENILLHDGQALVADFGIALAASSTGGTRMTETGMSLGTPHYMSPEQAMGEREITARSDVYALGVVAYEMLTGDPPFTGSTAQAIVARVVTEDPRSITLQRKTVPPHIEDAVFTALAKLPADRFATAAEFAQALAGEGPVHVTRRATAASATSPAGVGRRFVLLLGSLLLFTTALATWALLRPRPKAPVSRSALAFPPGQAMLPLGRLALSPDGSRLLYSGELSTPGGGGQIWVKRRDAYLATPLPGTGGAETFAVSPDGKWVAFGQGFQIRRTPIEGGPSEVLVDSANTVASQTWTEGGDLIYSFRGELRRVPAGGGPYTTIMPRDTLTTPILPVALPGSRYVLYIRCFGAFCRRGQDLWVLDAASGKSRQLLTQVAAVWYLTSGHLVLLRADGTALAADFDPKAARLEGPLLPVLEGVGLLNGMLPLMAVAPSGAMAMRLGGTSNASLAEMVWVDRGGRMAPVEPGWLVDIGVIGNNRGWALSPDGSQLALGLHTDAGDDIWIKQLPTGPLSRLTFDSAPEMRPRWSPDGRRVTFLFSATDANYNLLERRADGTGEAVVLADLPRRINEGQWSSDGRWLILRLGGETGAGQNLTGGRDIVGMRHGIDTVASPLVASPRFDEAAPAISPEGKWLAYESDETGRIEIYIRPFPATESGKWQVSSGGGQSPVWAGSGRELFYVNGAREMITVAIRPTAPPMGSATRLFALGDDILLDADEHYSLFDVSRDGRRFLVARSAARRQETNVPLLVVENWAEEVRQKLKAQ